MVEKWICKIIGDFSHIIQNFSSIVHLDVSSNVYTFQIICALRTPDANGLICPINAYKSSFRYYHLDL